MKNIRQGLFETNSSSSHSISIAYDSDGILDTLHVDEDGIVHLEGGEFGWEYETYHSAGMKANYCAVDTALNPKHREMLVKVICDHTGAKDVAFDFSADWRDDTRPVSYIDHQSDGTSHEAFASEDTLKRFLFNPKSYLTTDNDNH